MEIFDKNRDFVFFNYLASKIKVISFMVIECLVFVVDVEFHPKLYFLTHQPILGYLTKPLIVSSIHRLYTVISYHDTFHTKPQSKTIHMETIMQKGR